MENRIITTQLNYDDFEIEPKLRPLNFDSYIGQEKVKENMKIYIKAAKMRKESLDHILLYGPPGLGKTTLSNIIAYEMNVDIKITSGPAIERVGDIAAILNELNHGDVLFIDEIHRLNRIVEEALYPVMEDFVFDIIIGKPNASKSIRLELPKFTLIGATTKAGSLSSPFRDRFGVVQRLELYSDSELKSIVKRSANVLNIKITEKGSDEIAKRSRGTPRIANRLLKRVRDYAQVKYSGEISDKIAIESLDLLEVDKMGLDNIDRRLILTMINNFSGGPVGLETLSVSLGEDSETLEDVYEPYLIQIGFLTRTPRGRQLTELAYKYFGL